MSPQDSPAEDQDRALKPSPRVSILVPVYNEDVVLPELIARTLTVLNTLPGGPHELIFVDDGSSDGTFPILEAACANDPQITAIALSRNFGHQDAIAAALDYATGDAVVVMDGDLQDPPEAIPQFIEEYRRGYDVVYAIRTDRKEGLILRASYLLFYWTIRLLANINLPIGAGDFGLVSRRVADSLRAMPEQNPYLRGMRAWVGFAQKGVLVARDERHGGHTKYNWTRLIRLAFDGIFSFSLVPIRLALLTGLIAMGASIAYTAYAIVIKLVYARSPLGFTALVVAISFLSGVQLLFLGVIGEYIGRVFDEVRGRPRYLVRRVCGRS